MRASLREVRILPFLLPVALLAGCLHVPTQPRGVDGELITIQTQPGYCFGNCPWFDIRVSSSGQGILRVFLHDQVIRFRGFSVTPAQYRLLHDALAPLRPAGTKMYDDRTVCDSYATDMGDYRIDWEGRGAPGTLIVNDGCQLAEADRIREAIDRAIAILKIKGLPSPSSGVVASTRMSKR